MITKVHDKLLKMTALMALGSFICLAPGQASVDALGGSLIQATPYDRRISAAGVLSVDSAPALNALLSSDELFRQAKSIRYVSDAAGHDYWQAPQETQDRWSGDCEDKALWLFAQLKKNSHGNVRLVVGRHHSFDKNFHVWVTLVDGQNNVWILDPTAQKKIWRSSDFDGSSYKPLYSFDGINRYRHTS